MLYALLARAAGTALLATLLGTGMAWAAGGSDRRHDHHDQQHHHHHNHEHPAGELALALDNGERWATDEALRTGMTGILAAFSTAHDDYRAGNLDRAGAAALAERVDKQVNFIFANCNLPADADAELHKLLAATFAATSALRESDDPHDGLHQLHTVLKAYGEYFDHPGWSAEVSH